MEARESKQSRIALEEKLILECFPPDGRHDLDIIDLLRNQEPAFLLDLIENDEYQERIYWTQYFYIAEALKGRDEEGRKKVLERIIFKFALELKPPIPLSEDVLKNETAIRERWVDIKEFAEKRRESEKKRLEERGVTVMIGFRRGDCEFYSKSNNIMEALRNFFFRYQHLGITATFYSHLQQCFSTVRRDNDHYPTVFDKEYVAECLGLHQGNKKNFHEKLKESEYSEPSYQSYCTMANPCYDIYERYELEHHFSADLREYYDSLFKRIKSATQAHDSLYRYTVMQLVPALSNIKHGGFELLKLQNKLFSFMDTYYGKYSSAFSDHDKLLEFRDSVFDQCNLASLSGFTEEEVGKRMLALFQSLERFVRYANEHYPSSTRNFLSDVLQISFFQSYHSDGLKEGEKKGNDKVSQLLLVLKAVSKIGNHFMENEEGEKELSKEEREKGTDIGEASAEKGKEKEKESMFSPEESLRQKINRILIGKQQMEEGKTSQTVKPTKGQNYLFWLQDCPFFRRRHLTHGRRGRERARTLLKKVNAHDASPEDIEKALNEAYRDSRTRKHSLSRYLKAELNAIPLSVIFALRDEDFAKIKYPLQHNELSEEQVHLLKREPEKPSSSLILFSKKKNQPDDEAWAKLFKAENNKERYIAALEYVAAYPKSDITQQLWAVMEAEKLALARTVG